MKKLIWVTLFGISFGFVESAVVIYIRELLYPGGFDFPLASFQEHLAITEILREVATILMLLAAGILAGRKPAERFAWFIYAFAIWDIFFYVFLKLLIGWPDSLLTWDILFLIPVTWVGPVLTPIMLSAAMILLSQLILYVSGKGMNPAIKSIEWTLLICGSLIVITAFTWEYSGYILDHFSFKEIWTIPKEQLYDVAIGYIPEQFNWFLFITGMAVILSGILLYSRRTVFKF